MKHSVFQNTQTHEYLSPEHPDAFLDYPEPKTVPENYKQCPVCSGHGGWNLRTHSYPLPPQYESTAENRHRYAHFRCICSHCHGWGHVHNTEMCEGHEWAFEKNLGRCYNQYKCIHCGKIHNVDSSD